MQREGTQSGARSQQPPPVLTARQVLTAHQKRSHRAAIAPPLPRRAAHSEAGRGERRDRSAMRRATIPPRDDVIPIAADSVGAARPLACRSKAQPISGEPAASCVRVVVDFPSDQKKRASWKGGGACCWKGGGTCWKGGGACWKGGGGCRKGGDACWKGGVRAGRAVCVLEGRCSRWKGGVCAGRAMQPLEGRWVLEGW